jgi:hypothetical protein
LIKNDYIHDYNEPNASQSSSGDIKEFFMTVDNDNTTKSITLVVIRHALLMMMMATGMLMDYTPLNLDTTLSFVV